MKCLQYWPLETGTVMTFGEFKVSLRSTEIWSDFATSQLVVTKVKFDQYTSKFPHSAVKYYMVTYKTNQTVWFLFLVCVVEKAKGQNI